MQVTPVSANDLGKFQMDLNSALTTLEKNETIIDIKFDTALAGVPGHAIIIYSALVTHEPKEDEV